MKEIFKVSHTSIINNLRKVSSCQSTKFGKPNIGPIYKYLKTIPEPHAFVPALKN